MIENDKKDRFRFQRWISWNENISAGQIYNQISAVIFGLWGRKDTIIQTLFILSWLQFGLQGRWQRAKNWQCFIVYGNCYRVHAFICVWNCSSTLSLGSSIFEWCLLGQENVRLFWKGRRISESTFNLGQKKRVLSILAHIVHTFAAKANSACVKCFSLIRIRVRLVCAA